MEAQYRPVIQDKEEQLRSIFGNSAQNEAELMTIDQCETMRELNSSHLVGAPTSTPPPPPPPPPPPAGGDVNMVDVEVKTVASVKVADISTVKRKRGRPPKIQANATAATVTGTAATATATKLVDDEEDVCFICFDGGSLVLCDRRGCPKAYHPACIKRDEAFFKSKAKWNCGWHICSSCQRASHYMCYTCTYSLCKGCTRGADYVCVRGNKGFCGTCMRTIMLIEDSAQGNSAPVQVDFDDKTSWEYLFKIYWIVLKDRLSLTADEMRRAKVPWIGDEPPRSKIFSKMVANTFAPKEVQVGSGELHGTDEKSPCLDNHDGSVEVNHSMGRKIKDQMEVLNEQSSLATVQPANDKIMPFPEETKWATKELLEFVSHMKNGDTSVISQFDVQALLLDYIKRNNLRDPRQKSHIVCDARLIGLFGKQRVGHFEMLKLLEYHFLIKEKAPANDSVRVQVADAVGNQIEAAVSSETQTIVGNTRRRKTRKKMDDRGAQVNLNPEEYAAIDFHNINLLYLKRNLIENLMEDADKFCEKVVGSFVRIRILGGDQKQDMYRLVQVVGTSRVAESYKVGSKTTDIMLEILNLDKKEVISFDGISNQEFSEDECQRLRQTIKCGLIKRLKVGEIREKALALQPVKVADLLEAEISKLNHLRDRASEKGRRKDLRECVEKLDLLKSPMERQRRLLQIPDVHLDPHMNPSYRSDEDAGEFDKKNQGDNIKTRNSRRSRRGSELSSPFSDGVLNDVGNREQQNSASTSEQNRNVCTTSYVNGDGPIPVHDRANEFKIREGEGSFGLNKQNISKNQLDAAGLANCGQDRHSVRSESPIALPGRELSPGDSETEKLWHYQDPYGNVQGPFTMMQLRKWSTSGLFPPDLRVWRVDKKQDDSVLLTDALVGRCLKESQQPCNGNILPEEAATTSNNLNKIFEHVFGQSIEETLMDDKEFDDDREPVHNNSTVNVNNVGNDLERCNGLNATSSTWTRPVDVAITSDGKTQSSLQGWELSKDGKLYETPLLQPRGEHREKWDSHPSNADDRSQRTTECQIIVRESADKQADSDGHSSQSSGQNWRSQPVDSSLSGWDPNRGCVSAAKSDKKSGQNQEVVISDLPSQTVNQNHRESKGQAENKLSVSPNVPVQDSGPSFAPSLVGGQLPVASEWCRYSSVPSKPTVEEWDSNIVSASSLKPTEQASDHAAMTSSGPDKLTSSLPQHTVDASSWHSLVPEPGEFCSLADESVSDLLAEVEAMESLAGLPSPTSKLSCGGELTRGPGPENECFSPIEQFSSAPVPGKRDALSSTGDVQMPSQLTAASVLLRLSLMPYQPTVADETLAASQIPSQLTTTNKPHRLPQMPPHSMVPDDQHCTSEEPLGLWQNNAHDSRKSFRSHSSSIAEVEGNAKPNDISVDQWSTHSQRQLPASSTVNHREAGSQVQSSSPTVSRLEAIPDTHHPASSRADSKSGTVKEVINLNNGGVSQGSTNMVWGSSHRSAQQQGSTTLAVSTEDHGGWGKHGRSGGDNRFSGHRDHHRDYYPNKDSGYGRDRSSSYRQQPTYGNGGGSYNKPPGKGQRVCKFYENGYCRRGASCSYWHP